MNYEVFRTKNSTYLFDDATKLYHQQRDGRIDPKFKPTLFLGSLDLNKAKLSGEVLLYQQIPFYLDRMLKQGGHLPGFTPSFQAGSYAIGFFECRPQDIAAIGPQEINLFDDFKVRDLSVRATVTTTIVSVNSDISSFQRGYHMLEDDL